MIKENCVYRRLNLPVDNCVVEEIAELVAETYQKGNVVYICGNGGLAAESNHFAAELMGKYGCEVFIPCISLVSNESLITALANDYEYEDVFSIQVRTLGKPNDLLIAMTTSASRNIINAVENCRASGMKSILFCGSKADIGHIVDFIYKFGGRTDKIQEHILSILHKVAKRSKELVK